MQYRVYVFILKAGAQISSPLSSETSESIGKINKTSSWFLQTFIISLYIAVYFKPFFLDKFLYLLKCGVCCQSGKNLTVPRGWISHVASVQYIKTASIFSIRTYFWIHQIYFQLAHISSNLVSFSNRIHIYRGWFGPCYLCFKYTQKQKRKQKARNAVAPIKKRLCV